LISGSPLDSYPDSMCPKIVQTETLNVTWTKYTIDLLQTSQQNLGDVIGRFGWTADHPVTFYLDDIVYEFQ